MTNSKMYKIVDERLSNYKPPRILGAMQTRETRLMFVTLVKYGYSIRWFLLSRSIKSAGGYFKYAMKMIKEHNKEIV